MVLLAKSNNKGICVIGDNVTQDDHEEEKDMHCGLSAMELGEATLKLTTGVINTYA